MTCETCGEKPKKCGNCDKDFPRAVIEINNPEKIVLFRKVVVPASMGGRDSLPPAIGKYHNVLLEYEADGSLFLYSSDGIPTQLSTDVTDLQRQLDALGIEVDNERVERVAADEGLSDAIEEEVINRQDADTALGSQITNLDNSLATVARTGSYSDLSNKPTIGNATLTIKKNGSNVGTFTANATTNKNIDISVPTKTSNLVNDGSDGASQYVESDDLATVATSGSYNDLTNKPTIGNATLTIKRNNTSAGTFTANATTNKSINIAVPTKTSDITNDGSDGTSTYVETKNLPTVGNATLTITENNTPAGTFTANATSNKTINITSPTKTSDLTNDGSDGTSTYVESDDLPTVDTTYSSSSNNAIANSTVTNSLDRNVITNLTLDSTPSTTTVNLNNTKTNLAYPSSTTTSSISLPVASSTQAGVMNSSTFDAIASNTSNINAILSGAVAITGLPASPTQAELTAAWENETGLTSLMNRAGIYDVTNSKVWTYYTNDNTWYAASNTSQVTVSTFTNSSEGLIKGSTNDGQVFAENDGTGSVNGWDTLTSAVSSNTSKLATIAQGAEVNVQANWTQTNTNADDYIKNKPANLVQDANYVHTDNNFTTALKDKLNGISAGAEVNVQSDWSQTDTSADDYIKNKPANLVQDANYVHTDNNFTTTLKNKLDGIESGAEANVQADWAQSNTSADDYIKNKPTIPTVNNATLTIQKNGSNVQTFTANSSTNKTANITVPTAVSELTNDASYATTVQLSDGLATKQNTLTAGSNITIANDTISATDTTYTAGDAISIENGVISANVHPADFFDADEYVSDCGSTVNLSETVDSTIKSIELHGDTEQQTYSGKNLMPMAISDNTTSRVTNFKISLPAGTHTISFDLSDIVLGSNQSFNISITIAGAVSGGGNYDSIISGTISSTEATHKSFTFTTTADSDVSVNSNIRIAQTYWDNGARAKLSNIQIEAGSTATSYEPYTGGPAPNPDYPQDIHVVTGEQTVKVTGKNLWGGFINDYSLTDHDVAFVNYKDGSISANGTASSNAYSMYASAAASGGRTQQLPAGTYTLSGGTNTVRAMFIIPGPGTYYMTDVSTGKVTFTLSETASGYIRAYVPSGTSVNETIHPQLEKGSTATAYEIYQSQSYTIGLGSIELCKIGDYQDYIYRDADGVWCLHKAIGKRDVTSINSIYSSTGSGYIGAQFDVTDMASNSRMNGYCNILIPMNSPSGATTEGVTFGAGNKYVYMVLESSRMASSTVANWNAWLTSNPTIIYYPLATATDTEITDDTLIGQLNVLGAMRSYNDQTNITVAAASDNLPATLCVTTYRKSLDGVLDLINDTACTCKNRQGNLVIDLPNGMTTYTNDDAPIPISEVSEAFKRGQSVFLVDEALSDVYTVTAVNMDDGIWSMRADQTGINPRKRDGHWHINGGGDAWTSVTFINDATPNEYSPNIYNKTWFAFTNSTPLLDQYRKTYYPASSDVTFNNNYENLSVAELWEKLASSSWDGNPVILQIPLQGISTQTTSLVDNGFSAENPYLTIDVSLGPDNYFEREGSEYMINGWAAESTPITFDGKETYTVGVVRVVEDGNTTYSFVVSLTEVANPIN